MAVRIEHEAPANAVRPEAALLLTRLEERIIKGERLDQVRAVLQKEPLWSRLDIGDRLRWVELSQMAAVPQTARMVLDSLHRDHPDCAAAWEKHLELLSIIGPAKAFAALLARAKPHIGAERHRERLVSAHPAALSEEEEVAAAAGPFERYHHRVAAMRHFMLLFAGRGDCFARQWFDSRTDRQGYVPERRPMGMADLEEHLSGRKTYGIYLMQTDGRIRTAVIDADLDKSLRGRFPDAQTRSRVRREAAHLIARVKELSKPFGILPLPEFSGSKGYHFWYLFNRPAACAPVRAALRHIVTQLVPDLTAFHLEVFPKQDQPVGKGFGNLVKLPLGLHRGTGKRSYFLGCTDRSVEAQIAFLSGIQGADPEALIRTAASKSAQVVVHPRWRKWAEAYPALFELQSACAPLSQVMSLCLERGRLSLREEKILYQTIGFLPDGSRLLHYLSAKLPDYNPHIVDYRLSRLRGTPLGCRRIHSLLGYAGPFCRFTRAADYLHPLLHVENWPETMHAPAEKTVDLAAALDRLQTAIVQVERVLK